MTPEDAFAMVGMTPTERIENLLSNDAHWNAHSALHELLGQYEAFLTESGKLAEQVLEAAFAGAERRKDLQVRCGCRGVVQTWG